MGFPQALALCINLNFLLSFSLLIHPPPHTHTHTPAFFHSCTHNREGFPTHYKVLVQCFQALQMTDMTHKALEQEGSVWVSMVTAAMVKTMQTLQSHHKLTPSNKKEPFHYNSAMSVTTNDTKRHKILQTSQWEASQKRKLESSTNHSILMLPMAYHQGEIDYRAGKEKSQDRGLLTAMLHRQAEGGSLVPTANKSIEYRYSNTYRLA